MIAITILLVFLAGYAFCAWGVPFLDNIGNTLTVWFQKIQGKMAVIITEYSVQASQLKKDTKEEVSTHAVGFVIPSEYEEDDEDYDKNL